MSVACFTQPLGARCSFCDIAPVDDLVAELCAKCITLYVYCLFFALIHLCRYDASCIISRVVNVGDEEQVAAWINATSKASGIHLDATANISP
jgi:hypothetical protein